MIYLLGGAPRCGKSILARTINREDGLAVVSTDLLRGVLAPLLPALKAAMDSRDFKREADIFFPHLRQAALVLNLQLPNAVIEGVGFFPRHVAALREHLPTGVQACFLGRSSATDDALFGHATDHRLYERLSDEGRGRLAELILAWSAAIERECAEAALPYIDLALAGFNAGLAQAHERLFEGPAR